MRLIDRLARAAVRLGIGTRRVALLETIGRKSGEPRVTPVTNGLDRDEFWIVSEHGTGSDYVRNVLADARVRVRVGGLWRAGVATVVEDDPEERLDLIAARNPRARAATKIVRRTGARHVVVRVDLEPTAGQPR